MPEQKVVFVITHGEEYKERLEPPLHLATMAAALDAEVMLLYTMSAGLLLKKGVPENLFPMKGKNPYIETLRETKEEGVKIYVCSPVLEMYNLSREDFIDEVDDIVGGMFLVTESLKADVVYTF
ncbi:MAG: DsrE family protein [Candidatus Heimdallarchaeota archaeon]|nr:DsrE family protein [Candidatus Heimdallarchaeota archaeon]MCK4769597.1 DsrE family protein [Candidatus Heimdallarchaeota archaeon]